MLPYFQYLSVVFSVGSLKFEIVLHVVCVEYCLVVTLIAAHLHEALDELQSRFRVKVSADSTGDHKAKMVVWFFRVSSVMRRTFKTPKYHSKIKDLCF